MQTQVVQYERMLGAEPAPLHPQEGTVADLEPRQSVLRIASSPFPCTTITMETGGGGVQVGRGLVVKKKSKGELAQLPAPSAIRPHPLSEVGSYHSRTEQRKHCSTGKGEGRRLHSAPRDSPSPKTSK